MNDLQAALGISQLNRLNFFVKKRNSIARFYNKKLIDLPIILPTVRSNTSSSFHLYIIQINKELKKNRNTIFKKLLKLGIGVNVHYIPIHLQPAARKLKYKLGDFKITEAQSKKILTLPVNQFLKIIDLKKICKEINNFYEN